MEIFLTHPTRTFREFQNGEAIKTGRVRDAGLFVVVGDEHRTRFLLWKHGIDLFTPIEGSDELFLVRELSPIVMTMLLPSRPQQT